MFLTSILHDIVFSKIHVMLTRKRGHSQTSHKWTRLSQSSLPCARFFTFGKKTQISIYEWTTLRDRDSLLFPHATRRNLCMQPLSRCPQPGMNKLKKYWFLTSLTKVCTHHVYEPLVCPVGWQGLLNQSLSRGRVGVCCPGCQTLTLISSVLFIT